jgi:hypothetical protein
VRTDSVPSIKIVGTEVVKISIERGFKFQISIFTFTPITIMLWKTIKVWLTTILSGDVRMLAEKFHRKSYVT